MTTEREPGASANDAGGEGSAEADGGPGGSDRSTHSVDGTASAAPAPAPDVAPFTPSPGAQPLPVWIASETAPPEEPAADQDDDATSADLAGPGLADGGAGYGPTAANGVKGVTVADFEAGATDIGEGSEELAEGLAVGILAPDTTAADTDDREADAESTNSTVAPAVEHADTVDADDIASADTDADADTASDADGVTAGRAGSSGDGTGPASDTGGAGNDGLDGGTDEGSVDASDLLGDLDPYVPPTGPAAAGTNGHPDGGRRSGGADHHHGADAVATGSRPLGSGRPAPLFPSPDGPNPPAAYPTGPVPVADATTPDDDGAPVGRILLQSAIVLVAATFVGLAVFSAVRSAVGSAGDGDEAAIDESDLDDGDELIAPGPGDPGAVDSEGNSARATAGFGTRAPSDEAADEQADGGSSTPGRRSTPTTTSAPTDPLSPSGTSGNLQPAGPSTTDGSVDGSSSSIPGPTSSSIVVTSRPSSTFRSTTTLRSTATTRPSTSVTSSVTATTTTPPTPPTTRPTTTASTTTTRPATTTTAPPTTTTTVATTTTVPMPASLIRTPSSGASRRWDRPVTFRANEVPGATSYCWSLSGTGGSIRPCRAGPNYTLPGERALPGPGSVTVRAEAIGAGGEVLMSQQISIELREE